MAVPPRKRKPARRQNIDRLPQSLLLTVEAIEARKARDVVILDLRASTDMTDYFVICTADADVHARAILDAASEALLPLNRRPWHIEGENALTWALVDFVDVVVHVFREDTRQFYALEELWADAPRVSLPDTPHEVTTQAARSGRK